MKRSRMGGGRKGYLYTISVILLIMPLILLLIFYTGTKRTGISDSSERIRCDELYYFVQDVEYDMERAMLIFGRRAAVYAIDDVITNNRTMHNYTYNNCTDFVYAENGSEAAMLELVMCGTLYGENVTYMVNHTLPTWLDRIGSNADEMRYDINVTIVDFKALMSDAWTIALILDVNLDISDEMGLCYYEGTDKSLISLTDIFGLEDPQYPLQTNNRVAKSIYSCDQNLTNTSLANCDGMNLSCYIVSNISQYDANCSGENYPNGPSFFDRLDGRLELSERYVNQSIEYFDTGYIGIETIVDLDRLQTFGVEVHENATWIDYLYWAEENGSQVQGIGGGCAYDDLKLDCQHAHAYRLNTTEVSF